MRQKRAKTYRKLLHKYVLHFGFREPYQVLVDASFAHTLTKQKIDEPQKRIEDVAQGKAKVLITQCCMVQLYKDEQQGEQQKKSVEMAKGWERRKCNHREAVPVAECIESVIGTTNKHRYILASDLHTLRAKLRAAVPGLPMMHANSTGVLVMEPISALSEKKIAQIEQEKLASAHREGAANAAAAAAAIASVAAANERLEAEDAKTAAAVGAAGNAGPGPVRRIRKGPKAPNPLSVRRPKKDAPAPAPSKSIGTKRKAEGSSDASPSKEKSSPADGTGAVGGAPTGPKRKRRKRGGKGEASAAVATETTA